MRSRLKPRVYNMTEAKFPCATCNKEVQIRDHAIQCELCKSWEHTVCIKEFDRIPEGLYAMSCEMQCNALWAVCSVCRGKGSPKQKLQELETRVQLMAHQMQMDKLLTDEKERLIEHLQKELLEVKSERDKLQQTVEKQRVEQLQGTESKHALLESHLRYSLIPSLHSRASNQIFLFTCLLKLASG